MAAPSCLVRPKTPPPLNIPHSSSTVTVRVIDSTTSLFLDPPLFWRPEVKGFTGIHVPIYCFLISNGNRHVLFDLGVRRDWDNYAPKAVDLIRRTTQVKTEKNVSEILDSTEDWLGEEPAVRSKDIEAVILSHHHFDHIGDPSTFPSSTNIVLGPGLKDFCWPGYPTNPDSLVLDSDIQGHEVVEIDFTAKSPQNCKIGSFDAFDYFGDGSFYLLDAPGHSVGHICGLARVTSAGSGNSDADSFVFMGADACHHPGVLRPTEYLPLPETITPSPLKKQYIHACPGDIVQQLHPSKSATEPFLTVSPILFPDHPTAMRTVQKIEELDAADNIFIIIAHDESIKDSLELFPAPINDWKRKGLRSATRWLFCKDFEGAMH